MRRAAFSLVELLVVAAIVAVLAGLLLPAMGLVRASARATGCAANLRQIGLATAVYADEDGFLPAADGPAWWDASTWWTRALAPYLDEQAGRETSPSHARASVVWGCPEWTTAMQAEQAATLAAAGWTNGGMSPSAPGYAMQAAWRAADRSGWLGNSYYFLQFYGSAGVRNATVMQAAPLAAWRGVVPRAQLAYTSGQPLVYDYANWTLMPWWQNSPAGLEQRNFERHRRAANCLFGDGRVAPLSHQQWSDAVFSPWL